MVAVPGNAVFGAEPKPGPDQRQHQILPDTDEVFAILIDPELFCVFRLIQDGGEVLHLAFPVLEVIAQRIGLLSLSARNRHVKQYRGQEEYRNQPIAPEDKEEERHKAYGCLNYVHRYIEDAERGPYGIACDVVDFPLVLFHFKIFR